MAGLPIRSDEIDRARAWIDASGLTVETAGRVNLGRALGITEARAKGILEKLRFAAPSGALRHMPAREELSSSIRQLLKTAKKSLSVADISDRLDRSEKSVREAIQALNAQGFNVLMSDGEAQLSPPMEVGAVDHFVHDISHFDGSWAKFGATGDNHLCNKHQRLDVLNALYDIYEYEGITTVFNTGNWIDGEAGKLNKHELFVFGLDAQIDYANEYYPKRKGVTTYFLAGDDHEGWYQQRECIEIGRYWEQRAREAGREDLVYLGYLEADVEVRTRAGSLKVRVMHPGGGSAYALSYTGQKMVESFQGGEKPQILLQGHYHKFNVGYPREVWVVDTGTTCGQTTFMRKRKLQAMVGGCICHVHQDERGPVNRFRSEFIPFYDRSFYAKRQVA